MNRIKQRRREQKLTAAELARRIGVSQQMIFYYESGKRTPSVERLREIAKELNTTMDDLVE